MAPWTVLFANTLLAPWRKAVNQRFIRQAGEKLQQLRPVVIGVAGSYGKTSTKYFLDVMLRERHNVLKSPGNFNTLLGITRVVNDMLQPEHKLLIAEMGAYKRGEVKEITDLVHPRIGIITSIGPEHFERFLSMENIEATNYEVIEALPPDGLGVFNGENEHCVKLARATKHTRVALYGLARRDDLDLWAENVEHTSQGLQFDHEDRLRGLADRSCNLGTGRVDCLGDGSVPARQDPRRRQSPPARRGLCVDDGIGGCARSRRAGVGSGRSLWRRIAGYDENRREFAGNVAGHFLVEPRKCRVVDRDL